VVVEFDGLTGDEPVKVAIPGAILSCVYVKDMEQELLFSAASVAKAVSVVVLFSGTEIKTLAVPVPSTRAVANGTPEQLPLAKTETVDPGSPLIVSVGFEDGEGLAGFEDTITGTIGGMFS
jgi:hypothetical protein